MINKIFILFFLLTRLAFSEVYVATGSSSWNSEWWLNGQPAFVGHGAYAVDISRFVVNGDNRVELKLSAINKNPIKPDSKIVISESIFDAGKTIWVCPEVDAIKVKFKHDFEAVREFKWSWESGDVLHGTDDKSRILIKMVEDMLHSIELKDEEKYLEFPLGQWSKVGRDVERQSLQNRLLVFRGIKIDSLNITDASEFKVTYGSKMALIYSNSGPLLKGESVVRGMKVSVLIDYVFFYKLGDQWIALYP